MDKQKCIYSKDIMLNMDVVATFNEQPNHHQTNFIVFVTQMKSQSSIWFNFEEKKNEKKKRASNKGLLKKGQI